LGFASAVAIIGAADGAPQGIADNYAFFGFLLGAFAFGLGAWSRFGKSRQMHRVLAREECVQRFAHYQIGTAHGIAARPALVIAADAQHPEAVCQVFALPWRAQRLAQGHGLPLLVFGDPTRWAVVAAPSLDDLIVVKKPLAPWIEQYIRRTALEG
jgi:hypothetical protein